VNADGMPGVEGARVCHEVIEEARRLGGGEGFPLDALLIHVEGGVEMVREQDDTAEDGGVPTAAACRRKDLLSLAAWALLALMRHDEAPTAALDAMPAKRLL